MSVDTETPDADPESSVEAVNTEFCTDLQRSDWNHQPQALSDRADLQYTDKGWELTSSEAGDTPELSPCSARTTFYAKELGQCVQFRNRRVVFERLWKRQWNRGHKWVGEHNLVRQEATLRLCDATLQQCEVWEVARRFALTQVRTQNLRGYSRHYSGAYGACVGFALYRMYFDKQEAIGSYVARRAADILPGLDKDEVDNLIDYTFRRQNDE